MAARTASRRIVRPPLSRLAEDDHVARMHLLRHLPRAQRFVCGIQIGRAARCKTRQLMGCVACGTAGGRSRRGTVRASSSGKTSLERGAA